MKNDHKTVWGYLKQVSLKETVRIEIEEMKAHGTIKIGSF